MSSLWLEWKSFQFQVDSIIRPVRSTQLWIFAHASDVLIIKFGLLMIVQVVVMAFGKKWLARLLSSGRATNRIDWQFFGSHWRPSHCCRCVQRSSPIQKKTPSFLLPPPDKIPSIFWFIQFNCTANGLWLFSLHKKVLCSLQLMDICVNTNDNQRVLKRRAACHPNKSLFSRIYHPINFHVSSTVFFTAISFDDPFEIDEINGEDALDLIKPILIKLILAFQFMLFRACLRLIGKAPIRTERVFGTHIGLFALLI